MSNGNAYPPVVIRVKVKCRNLSDYNIKEFYGEDVDWKRFICANRWYHNIVKIDPDIDNNVDSRYDIAIGLTADGKMSRLNRLIKEDGYSLSENFLKEIKPFKTTYSKTINSRLKYFETKAYQISIHNKTFARHCIDFKIYDIIHITKEGDGL